MKISVSGAALLAAAFVLSPAVAQTGWGWPGGFAGHLEPAQLVRSMVTIGQPLRRGLAVDFKLAPIEDGEMFVEAAAMDGLPFDQTREEMEAGRTSVVIDMPYNFSATAQTNPAELQSLIEHAAAQLARYRVAERDESADAATCSGLRTGSEWTARATDARCETMLTVTYRCTLTDMDGRSQGLWLRTDSTEAPVDDALASHCG